MKLIQEIKQDDFSIKVYYTDNIDIGKYGIDDYKIAKIVFSFLDKFKEMIRFKNKFHFQVKFEDKNLIFTYTDDLLLLVDINYKKTEEENIEKMNDEDYIIFD